jgi:hypothetical protein
MPKRRQTNRERKHVAEPEIVGRVDMQPTPGAWSAPSAVVGWSGGQAGVGVLVAHDAKLAYTQRVLRVYDLGHPGAPTAFTVVASPTGEWEVGRIAGQLQAGFDFFRTLTPPRCHQPQLTLQVHPFQASDPGGHEKQVVLKEAEICSVGFQVTVQQWMMQE